MALIDHVDSNNRRIYLSAETVDASIHPIDIYKEMRALRRLDESLRPYDVFLKAYGNVSKGAGKYTERYVICQSGTKLVPYDTTHVLTVTGTILTDDGQEGVYCFDRSLLSAGVVVDINYQPPQVEVITVSTGSGLSQEEHNHLMSIPENLVLSNDSRLNNLDTTISSRASKDDINKHDKKMVALKFID